MVLPVKGFALCEVHLLLKAWRGCSDPLGGKFLLPISRLLEDMLARLPSVQHIGAWLLCCSLCTVLLLRKL